MKEKDYKPNVLSEDDSNQEYMENYDNTDASGTYKISKKKTSKKIFSIVIVAVCVLALGIGVCVIYPKLSKIARGFKYELNADATVTITGTVKRYPEVIDIPEKIYGHPVTAIGEDAFAGFDSLTKVTIPTGVTKIGNLAFLECSSLAVVTMPDSLTEICEGAFSGCDSLTSVTIPDSVTEIGEAAFMGCESLTSVTIPDSVTEIDDLAFIGCESLTSIIIPKSVTKIGRCAFASTPWLDAQSEEFVIVGDGVLLKYNGDALDVVIPNGVNLICDAFFNNKIIKSVSIPAGLTEIGMEAFSGCESLKTVNIPDGVTSIGMAAFRDCSTLTAVTMPESVTNIEKNAFERCSNLTLTVPAGSYAETWAKDNHMLYMTE